MLAGLGPELPLLLIPLRLNIVDFFEAEIGRFASLLRLFDDLISLIALPTEEEIAPDCHKDHTHADEDEQFG